MIFGSEINVSEGFSEENPQDAPRQAQDATRRSQDGPRRSQDVPRRPQDAPKAPQDGPGAPQDAPKRRPSTSQEWKKLGSKSDLQRTPLQTSISERLGMDLGRFLDGFRELLESIFHGFYG